MSDVVIVQRVLPHYRLAFIDRLAEALASQGQRLRVVYGQEFAGEVPETADVERPWGVRVHIRYFASA